MAATQMVENDPDEVAMKVLRRAQVSKMTRALQDRLALANVKIQNGWQNLSLDAIEPRVEERLRRKRPASSNDTISDTASTTSSRLHSSSGPGSSPLTGPIFSDEFPRSGSSHGNKRIRPADIQKFAAATASSGGRGAGTTGRRNKPRQYSWKSSHSLPESSPITHTKHARFHSSTNAPTQLSFISEGGGSTIPDEDPPSPEFSEDDDADLPVHSFSLNPSTRITSSPPQTPPPDRRMMRKTQNISWSRTPKTGEEGADLLLYLATSPLAENGRVVTKTLVQPPSTPPCKSTPLPSSHMTPGMNGAAGFLGFGPNTPGTNNFNFTDFINVTPSPAQGPWSSSRTPVAAAAGGRTPAAAKEARRKLNFDSLMPPSATSPMLTRNPNTAHHHHGRSDGLGMELGGELVSSQ